MKTFKDASGDEWMIKLDVGVCEVVNELADLDLMVCLTGPNKFQEMIAEQSASLFKFGKTLWALCRDEATERNLDQKAFAKRFDGPTLGSAFRAFTDEVASFFDDFRQSSMLTTITVETRKAAHQFNDRARTEIREAIQSAAREAMTIVTKKLQSINGQPNNSGGEFGKPLEESESIPADSPTAN